MRLIDADALIKEANADGAYGYVSAEQIANAPHHRCRAHNTRILETRL